MHVINFILLNQCKISVHNGLSTCNNCCISVSLIYFLTYDFMPSKCHVECVCAPKCSEYVLFVFHFANCNMHSLQRVLHGFLD